MARKNLSSRPVVWWILKYIGVSNVYTFNWDTPHILVSQFEPPYSFPEMRVCIFEFFQKPTNHEKPTSTHKTIVSPKKRNFFKKQLTDSLLKIQTLKPKPTHNVYLRKQQQLKKQGNNWRKHTNLHKTTNIHETTLETSSLLREIFFWLILRLHESSLIILGGLVLKIKPENECSDFNKNFTGIQKKSKWEVYHKWKKTHY